MPMSSGPSFINRRLVKQIFSIEPLAQTNEADVSRTTELTSQHPQMQQVRCTQSSCSLKIALFALLAVNAHAASEVAPINANITAEDDLVGTCLDALSFLPACALSSQQGACCAALDSLESRGCFGCQAAYSALLIFSPGMEDLVKSMLPLCVPEGARFNASSCPSPAWDSECGKSSQQLRNERLGTVNTFMAEMGSSGDSDKPAFDFNATEDRLKALLMDNVTFEFPGAGTYHGPDGVMEYLILTHIDVTGGLIRSTGEFAYGWTLLNGASAVASATKTKSKWLDMLPGTAVERDISYLTEYGFDGCDTLLSFIMVVADNQFMRLLSQAPRYGWGSNFICTAHEAHCAGTAHEQFASYDNCVRFQENLPERQCSDEHYTEGNASACKYRHAMMVPFSPAHHCAHIGTGHLPDDTGGFVCAPSDCDAPMVVPTVIKPPFQVPYYENATMKKQLDSLRDPKQDQSICSLDHQSNGLFLAIGQLSGSSCVASRTLLKQPPALKSRRTLRGLCSAQEGNCKLLRYNLEWQIDRFDASCNASALSEMPGAFELLKAARLFVAHHRATCLFASAEELASILCTSCGGGSGIVDWAEARRLAGPTETRDEWDGPNHLSCRADVHFACASIDAVGATPSFCEPCFFSPDSAVCAASVTDWFQNASCASTTAAWWETLVLETPLSNDTYPGNPDISTVDYDASSKNLFDFIVVGAGNAGSVVARRLSDAGFDVLVLEEGLDWRLDRDLWKATRPRASTFSTWSTPLTHIQTSLPNQAMHNRTVDVFWGSALGGTTIVNAGLYSRPSNEEFTNWPDGWDLSSYYKRVESWRAPTNRPSAHGTDGPVVVTPGEEQHLVSEWLDAAAAVGVNVLEDGATGDAGLSGVYRVNTAFDQRGYRQDAFSTYLEPAKNTQVRTMAQVTEILFDQSDGGNPRAIGVKYVFGTEALVAYVRREVIISAGVYGSPRLLMLSGVGAHDELEDMHIKQKVELPGVGKQLEGRPLFQPMYSGSVLANQANPFVANSEDEFRRWEAGKRSIYDVPIASAYGKGSDGFLLEFTDSIATAAAAVNSQGVLCQSLSSMCKVCHPKSKGEVTLSATGNANVDFNFYSDESDLDVMLNCTRQMLAINNVFSARGMDLTGIDALNDAELTEHIRSTTISSHHAFGTCRMGTGPLDVVDERLRVRGIRNLRIADASVIPDGPCSGPMATVYALGEKAAEMMIEDNAHPADIFGAHVMRGEERAKLLGIIVAAIAVLLTTSLIVQACIFYRQAGEPIRTHLELRTALPLHRSALCQTVGPDPKSEPLSPPRKKAPGGLLRSLTSLRSLRNLKNNDGRAPLAHMVSKVVGKDAVAHMRERAGFNMIWSNVTYSPIRGASSDALLVKGVDGACFSGELTFLMGPSGSYLVDPMCIDYVRRIPLTEHSAYLPSCFRRCW